MSLDLIPHGSEAARLVMVLVGPSNIELNPDWKRAAYVFGLLSGYPICCVEFFAEVWMPLMEVCGEEATNKAFPQTGDYVQCPRCKEGRS